MLCQFVHGKINLKSIEPGFISSKAAFNGRPRECNIMCCDWNSGELFIVYSTQEVVVMPGNPEPLPSVIITEKRI
jgi:hypothetical protein